MSQPVNDDAIDFFEIDQDITLRRMVLRNSNPKGTVLFLHGFPENRTPGRTSPRLWPMRTRSTLSTGRVMASHPGQRSTGFPMRPKTTREFWIDTSARQGSTHRS